MKQQEKKTKKKKKRGPTQIGIKLAISTQKTKKIEKKKRNCKTK